MEIFLLTQQVRYCTFIHKLVCSFLSQIKIIEVANDELTDSSPVE